MRRYSENGGTVSHTSSPTMFSWSWIPASMPVSPRESVGGEQAARNGRIRNLQFRVWRRVRMLGRSMDPSPVTVTFPAAPEYLRLARIATADAASRAGLDYEEIDDVRIAVSELCSLVSVDAGSTVTLAFLVSTGSLTVEGESRTGRDDVVPNELSQAIVAAVADEHSLVTDDGVTRFRVVQAQPAIRTAESGRVRTRRRRLSGDWSLRRPGREGPAPSNCPPPPRVKPPRPIFSRPPLQSIDAAQAAAPAALRRDRRRGVWPSACSWC